MPQKIIIIILGLFLLSGCSDNFRDYFKRSANNKLIDRKGFEGSKRAPLYNKKYIATAKRNVVEENFDDEEDLCSEFETETVNPIIRRNRKMYLKMVQKDADRIRKEQEEIDDQGCTLLATASNKVNRRNKEDTNTKLQKELDHIKAMLHDTKKDLERYKCPSEAAKNIKDEKIESSEIVLPSELKSERQTINLEPVRQKRSVMKNKFITEGCEEDINDNSRTTKRINNTLIDEYEKAESPPREI
ncbi:MAG: hypothetical protein LN588_03840 [Rickettsia endosymbiont of Bryobia graminum]|nr:hypothetical protein [Rickettsia endosymbiont of Bryobia graminum]